MRFLQIEHRDIKEAIEVAGFVYDDFRSVKRQGKLHLFYKDHTVPFKFFRKKETRLNADGKWEERATYLIYRDGKGAEVDGWEEVKKACREWLRSL